MTSSKEDVALRINRGQISILGSEGYHHNGKWVTNRQGFPLSNEPHGVSSAIYEELSVAMEQWLEDEVEHLRVSPSTAVILFLEGVISEKDVHFAEIGSEIGYESRHFTTITFRNVIEFGGERFDVVVSEEVQGNFFLADLDGEAVEFEEPEDDSLGEFYYD